MPIVWILRKAAVEPRGMQPRPQAIIQEIKTALMGMLRVGETCTGLGVLFGGDGEVDRVGRSWKELIGNLRMTPRLRREDHHHGQRRRVGGRRWCSG